MKSSRRNSGAKRLALQRREVGPDGWTCHVCGDYRPDARIGVYSRLEVFCRVPVTENIRYCVDRPACVEGAKTKTFLPS